MQYRCLRAPAARTFGDTAVVYLFRVQEAAMFTLLMLIASALIVGGLVSAVLCMEQTLAEHPADR